MEQDGPTPGGPTDWEKPPVNPEEAELFVDVWNVPTDTLLASELESFLNGAVSKILGLNQGWEPKDAKAQVLGSRPPPEIAMDLLPCPIQAQGPMDTERMCRPIKCRFWAAMAALYNLQGVSFAGSQLFFTNHWTKPSEDEFLKSHPDLIAADAKHRSVWVSGLSPVTDPKLVLERMSAILSRENVCEIADHYFSLDARTNMLLGTGVVVLKLKSDEETVVQGELPERLKGLLNLEEVAGVVDVFGVMAERKNIADNTIEHGLSLSSRALLSMSVKELCIALNDSLLDANRINVVPMDLYQKHCKEMIRRRAKAFRSSSDMPRDNALKIAEIHTGAINTSKSQSSMAASRNIMQSLRLLHTQDMGMRPSRIVQIMDARVWFREP